MSDVFDEDDAELVLRLYLKSPSVIARFVHFRATDEKTRLHMPRLERMGVITIYPSKHYCMSDPEHHFHVTLNKDHPDVTAIIDAMELL